MRRTFLILLSITILIGCTACDGVFRAVKGKKTYTVDNMSITVADIFFEAEAKGFTYCLDSAEVAVYILKEVAKKDKFPDFTPERYAKNFLKKQMSEIKFLDNIPYGEYTVKGENGKEYTYFAAFYKNGENFWSIQFTCLTSEYERNLEDFKEWAKTVTFS